MAPDHDHGTALDHHEGREGPAHRESYVGPDPDDDAVGRATARSFVAPLLDAGRLVGLLAEPSRLRVVAALVLGAGTAAEVGVVTGLDARGVGSALARLVDAELVVRGADGEHVVLEAAFADAARAAAPRPSADEHGDAPDEAARVLRVFVRDGRITQIPMQRSKRLVVLDRLAQEFELGERYSESMVNLILGRWHPDTAAWRRYLVDEGFLSRDHGVYWRTGGTVDVT